MWDELQRKAPKFKKKDLDERREKNLIPGTKLTALRQDDRVPVLLIQRSLEHPGCNADSLHGWTLIIPSGWSMAFWSSLIYTGTRVGGQRECQTQAFEAGVPSFPRDYPFTDAYDEYAEETEREAKEEWERKPPAKRPNYKKLNTRSAWRPDWEVVMGLKKEDEDDQGVVSTQREEVEMNVDTESVPTWLLCGQDVRVIVGKLLTSTNPGTILQAEINAMRAKRSLDPLTGPQLLEGALVGVRIKMHGRGSPEDMAMLYAMSDEEVVAWAKDMKRSEAEKAMNVDEEEESAVSTFHPHGLGSLINSLDASANPSIIFNHWLCHDRSFLVDAWRRVCPREYTTQQIRSPRTTIAAVRTLSPVTRPYLAN